MVIVSFVDSTTRPSAAPEGVAVIAEETAPRGRAIRVSDEVGLIAEPGAGLHADWPGCNVVRLVILDPGEDVIGFTLLMRGSIYA